MTRIDSAPALHAHAIAMQREAAARYAELAGRMADEGREDLASLFAMLSAAGYRWLDADAPEAKASEIACRLMTPRQALAVALQAERRALAFFRQLSLTSADAAVRAMAREMAGEELGHVGLIADLLEGMPGPRLDTPLIFEKAR